jgi:hypothetical protein
MGINDNMGKGKCLNEGDSSKKGQKRGQCCITVKKSGLKYLFGKFLTNYLKAFTCIHCKGRAGENPIYMPFLESHSLSKQIRY